MKNAQIASGHYVHGAECGGGDACVDGPNCGFQPDPPPFEPILPGRTPSPATLDAFCDAARALKSAEEAYRAAQQSYAEAVKAMSEEAVR